MQEQLRVDYPELDIEIIGVNDYWSESGNDSMCNGKDLPWLQDTDTDIDGISDVWNTWEVTPRDVVILDHNNALVDRYNLTSWNLADANNYSTLYAMLVDTALPGWQNQSNHYDVNNNGIINSIDLLRLIRDINEHGNRQVPSLGGAEPAIYTDVNGDNIINPVDVVQMVHELNRLAMIDSPEGEPGAESSPVPANNHTIQETIPLLPAGVISELALTTTSDDLIINSPALVNQITTKESLRIEEPSHLERPLIPADPSTESLTLADFHSKTKTSLKALSEEPSVEALDLVFSTL